VRVLVSLSSEGIPRTDLPGLLRCVAEAGPRDAEACVEWLRSRMRASLTRWLAPDGVPECIAIHPVLQVYVWWLARNGGLEAGHYGVAHLIDSLRAALAAYPKAAVLCLPALRPVLRRLLRTCLPHARVVKADDLDPASGLWVRQVTGLSRLDLVRMLWSVARIQRADPEAWHWFRADSERFWGLVRRADSQPTTVLEPEEEPPPMPLGGIERAAVFLLECRTWLMRQILAQLRAQEIAILERHMGRLARRSLTHRNEVLDSFPGHDPEQPDVPAILAEIRRLLDEDLARTPWRELALCLVALGPGYRVLSGYLYPWLDRDASEAIQAELAGLRGCPSQASRAAVSRFLAFYRGQVQPWGGLDGDFLEALLSSSVQRHPQRMAIALMRLWLGANEELVDGYRHWAAQNPARAARWLLRWHSDWRPGPSSPLDSVRAAFRRLPREVAEALRDFLPEEAWRMLAHGPASPDWSEAARTWLAESRLHTGDGHVRVNPMPLN
ncbi:MAG: hypothetical protein AB1758_34820, partial [Candidatus Eremiobacterota bacterium]